LVVSFDLLCVHQSITKARIAVLMSFAVITFAFGVIASEVWDTGLPVWAFVFALIICVSASQS
jgi:hypothetical protein